MRLALGLLGVIGLVSGVTELTSSKSSRAQAPLERAVQRAYGTSAADAAAAEGVFRAFPQMRSQFTAIDNAGRADDLAAGTRAVHRLEALVQQQLNQTLSISSLQLKQDLQNILNRLNDIAMGLAKIADYLRIKGNLNSTAATGVVQHAHQATLAAERDEAAMADRLGQFLTPGQRREFVSNIAGANGP